MPLRRGMSFAVILWAAFIAVNASGLDVEELVQANQDAVLVITGTRPDTGAAVQGSGVCVATAGYVLATAHQVEGVQGLQGRRMNGAICALTPVLVSQDIEYALLKSDSPLPVAVRLGDADTLKSGAPLISIAAPMNLEFSTVTGTVSHPNRTYQGYSVIQAVLNATHGSSGGPVFDKGGELVGLISGELTEANFTLVNRINNAYPLLEQYGIIRTAPQYPNADEYELVPAPDVSEMEFRAVEAYNRGVYAETPAGKTQAYALAVKLLPGFFEAWFNLAIAANAAGEPAASEAAYRRAAALRPESVEVQRNLGRLLLREKRFDEASACFEAALRFDSASAQSYNDLGEAYRLMKRYEDAVHAFEEALKRNPDYAQAAYNLALSYAALDRKAEAAQSLERYLALSPGASDAKEVGEWIQQLRQGP